jgi:hypothetical protein
VTYDYSFHFFAKSAVGIFAWLANFGFELHRDSGDHFLTHIDAAAAGIPPNLYTFGIRDAIEKLLCLHTTYENHKNDIWKRPTNTTNETEMITSKLHNCKLDLFLRRLHFYMGRYTQKSMLEIRLSTQQMHSDLGLSDFDIQGELLELDALILHADGATRVELFANIEMEWVGPKIPIEEISTVVAGSAYIDCLICHGRIVPPGVSTKPCGHTYCKACLESWIQAAQEGSHTCPYCRTQLFPKPTYRVKDLQLQQNYEETFRSLNDQAAEGRILARSLAWLRAEFGLQEAYEHDLSHLQQNIPGETAAVPM